VVEEGRLIGRFPPIRAPALAAVPVFFSLAKVMLYDSMAQSLVAIDVGGSASERRKSVAAL
jgi:hypothetical protein